MQRLLLIFLLISEAVFAQYTVDFNRGNAVLLGNNKFSLYGTNIDFSSNPYLLYADDRPFAVQFSNSAICDKTGRILFYTNGIFISDSTNHILIGHDTLNSGSTHTNYILNIGWGIPFPQTTVILPCTYNDDLFYIFHLRPDFLGGNHYKITADYLMYSSVDMDMNNGLGGIASINQSIIRDTFALGMLNACRHGNGRDWWILASESITGNIYKVLYTPFQMEIIDKQDVSNKTYCYCKCWSSFSPDGSMYIRSTFGSDYSDTIQLELWSFDRCDGTLYNYLDLTFLHHPVGWYMPNLVFSPSSRFLYLITDVEVYQYDLWAANIAQSRTLVAQYDGFTEPNVPMIQVVFATPFLANDGKIYIVGGQSSYLHVIENPDSAGLQCNVKQHHIKTPIRNYWSATHYPNFRLGPLSGSVCDSLAIGMEELNKEEQVKIKAYPNPATTAINFSFTKKDLNPRQLEISSVMGIRMRILSIPPMTDQIEISLSDFEDGIYFAKLSGGETNDCQVCKFIVLKQ